MSTTYHTYDTHPASEIFPMMEDKDIKELADDIRINGLREPITTFGGKVLDGRNRIKACEIANVEPEFVELPPDESPARYVWSKNLSRRHLSASQRSIVMFALQEILAKEAKSRMSRGGTLAVRKGVEIIPHAEQGRTRDIVAKMADVNPRYISEAKTIQDRSPELAAEVLAGTVTIPEAKRRLKGENAEKSEAEKAHKPSFDATLLVVDLVIGSEDRNRRKDILQSIYSATYSAHSRNSPCVIMINERYREGTVQSFMPRFSSSGLPENWNSIEGQTRITSCQAFPLMCRTVKPRSSNIDMGLENLAANILYDINHALDNPTKRIASNLSLNSLNTERGDPASADIAKGQQDGELIPPPTQCCSKSG